MTVHADAGVRRWLMACVVAVLLAVGVGGATRLTESGLSITEWRPISGIVPPSSAEAWDAEYQAFLRIPQAQSVHAGITLDGFKSIYWWEWIHRIVARGVGLVFAIPYVVFLARGRIPRGYRLRLAALPALTLAQGALGWYMVQSGLVTRVSVSAYRLTAHLALALAILAVALWALLEFGTRVKGAASPPLWRRAVVVMAGMIAITVLSGGFVAGLDAGRIYNTFPLMGGGVIPPGYAQLSPWWVNPFENPAAAQFNHRVLAMLTATVTLAVAFAARATSVAPAGRRALHTVGGVVIAQVVIGITTLLLAVPVWLGVLHQLTGVLALTVAIVATHRVLTAGDAGQPG